MSIEQSGLNRSNLENDAIGNNKVEIQLQFTPIFKLNVDCCEEIIELLSLRDLYSLGQTCKPMRKVAGEYFKENYSATDIMLAANNSIEVNLQMSNVSQISNIVKMSNFNEFTPKLVINFEKNHHKSMQIEEFTSLKYLCLENGSINRRNINYIRKVLPIIEILEVASCEFDNLYENLLKFCTNLKSLCFRYFDSIEFRFDWLQQDYPQLEHLNLMRVLPIQYNDELLEFLKRHPNVQKLSIHSIYLWTNREYFLKSTINLDTLELFHLPSNDQKEFELLNKLHENGFFKRLHLNEEILSYQNAKQISALHWIEKLDSMMLDGGAYNLSHVKHLIVQFIKDSFAAKQLAMGLEHVEQIYLEYATYEEMLPFLQYSPKLNKIKIKFSEGIPGGALNLKELNKLRKMVKGRAQKVTIYVDDEIFVKTKWAAENGNLNYDLVELKRIHSFE